MLKLVDTPAQPLPAGVAEVPAGFAEILRRDLMREPPRRKGERTRALLIAAAAAAMDAKGFDKPRVVDITDQAHTSTAAFYVYFRDLQEGAGQVLRAFAGWLFEDPVRSSSRGSRTREVERRVQGLFERAHGNLNLLRALDRAVEEQPTLASEVRSARRIWVRALVGRPVLVRGSPLAFRNATEVVDGLVAGLLRETSVTGVAIGDLSGLAAAISRILQSGIAPTRPDGDRRP